MGNVDGYGRDGMEIDVYESPYFQQASLLKKNAVSSALHYDGYGEAHRVEDVGYTQVKKPYDTFHNYGLEWNENEYIFYIDGRETGRSSFGGVSQVPEYLILSLEQQFSGWAGDISLNQPGEMTDFVIDYVRAYQYA
jgi:beta-glucanase (GH16 family)